MDHSNIVHFVERRSRRRPGTCGEAQCPQCDGQLWHLALGSGPAFFVRRDGESIYDLMADLAAPRHGFSAEELEAILRDADALDMAEFLATLEHALRS